MGCPIQREGIQPSSDRFWQKLSPELMPKCSPDFVPGGTSKNKMEKKVTRYVFHDPLF
jgi:hypothetical protein